MNACEVEFDETLTAATLDGKTVLVDWFDADEHGMITEFRAVDGRVFDVSREGSQSFAKLRG